MVYGTNNYSFHGLYKPTFITTGAPQQLWIQLSYFSKVTSLGEGVAASLAGVGDAE